ncbi:MAG: hypothetical protein WCW26_00050 [Candidatus Buchananbacteria bacterium]
MKTLNWKEVGRFLSVVQNLYAVIHYAFSGAGVGLEIIEVDENTIRVNLDAPPTLPFNGAMVKTNRKGGWVTLQKRADGLYQDGHKFSLYRSEYQKNGQVIGGYDLGNEVVNLPVVHPNIEDALLKYPHLIPEKWKKDENGNTIYIYFWAVTFSDRDGRVCVRCMCFDDDGWRRDCVRLDGSDFGGRGPAAVLTGNLSPSDLRT